MMKKIFGMGIALAVLAATPAHADNSEEVIIGVMGGVIGGMILGGAIANERHAPRAYYEEVPPPRRVYRREYIEENCVTVVTKRWDAVRHRTVKYRRVECY